MTIKNFKTIIISKNVAPGIHGDPSTTFSIPIFLPFIPSHFIIKAVSYCITSMAGTTNNILLLKSSLLNNESILSILRIGGAIAECYLYLLDTKFKMNPNVISGNINFTLSDINGVTPIFFTNLQFALTIEFIEEI